jgi:excisionase family DNA binding protein
MDRLLTADELAERLGMKTEWVWAQARAGRIPHVRLGRYRRFHESAVEEWLREIETGGTGRPSARSRDLSRCAAAHSHRRASGGLRTLSSTPRSDP